MESKPEKIDEVTISFGKHYNEIFEARDLFENQLLKFLKIIQDNLKLNENEWQWGWDCDGDYDVYNCHEDLSKNKPFFIDSKSRIYLYNNDSKEKYYALFGFSFDIENTGGGIVFFTSIAASEESKTDVLKELKPKEFKAKVLYDGEYILYGRNILRLENFIIEDAIKEVERLIKAWKDFNKKKAK